MSVKIIVDNIQLKQDTKYLTTFCVLFVLKDCLHCKIIIHIWWNNENMGAGPILTFNLVQSWLLLTRLDQTFPVLFSEKSGRSLPLQVQGLSPPVVSASISAYTNKELSYMITHCIGGCHSTCITSIQIHWFLKCR